MRPPGPMIATALLVATSLSGCFWADDVGNHHAAAPSMSFIPDENADRLVIGSAATGADWQRLSIQVESCKVTPSASAIVYGGSAAVAGVRTNSDARSTGAGLNQPRAGATCGPPNAKGFSTHPDPITAGDFIAFCVTPSTAKVTLVNLRMVDVPANQILLIHTFQDVRACP